MADPFYTPRRARNNSAAAAYISGNFDTPEAIREKIVSQKTASVRARELEQEEAGLLRQLAEIDSTEQAEKALKAGVRERERISRGALGKLEKEQSGFVETERPRAEKELRGIERSWKRDEEAARAKSLAGIPIHPALPIGGPTDEAKEAQTRLPRHREDWMSRKSKLEAADIEAKRREENLARVRETHRRDVEMADAVDAAEYVRLGEELGLDSSRQPRPAPVPGFPSPPDPSPVAPQPSRDAQSEPETPGLAISRLRTMDKSQWSDAEKAAWRALAPEEKRRVADSFRQTGLQNEILSQRRAILDREPGKDDLPEDWSKRTPEQKRGFLADFQHQKEQAVAAFDERQSAMSPDRAAIVKAAQGGKPLDELSAFGEEISGRTRTAAAAAGQAYASVGTGLLDLATAAQAAFGAEPGDTWTKQFADGVRQFYDSAQDDEYRDAAATRIVSGLASAHSFMAPTGIVGKALGGSPKALTVAAGITGAVVNGGQAYSEALDAGMTDAQAFQRLGAGMGLGLTEAAGVGGILAKLNKLSRGGLGKFFRNLAGQGLEEGTQESIQSAGQDLADILILGKDDPRTKRLEQIKADAIENGLWGAATGVIFTGLVDVAQRRDFRNRAVRSESDLNSIREAAALVSFPKVAEGIAERHNAGLRGEGGERAASDVRASGFDPAAGKFTVSQSDTLPVLEMKLNALQRLPREGKDSENLRTIDQAAGEIQQLIAAKIATPEIVQVAIELTPGLSGAVTGAEAKVSQAETELAMHSGRETFFSPADLEERIQAQGKLSQALANKLSLARSLDGGNIAPRLAQAREILRFPDAPADPNQNGRPNGSNQRQIALAIAKAANGIALTDAESNLRSGNGRPIFQKDKKSGLVTLSNPETATALQKESPAVFAAWQAFEQRQKAAAAAPAKSPPATELTREQLSAMTAEQLSELANQRGVNVQVQPGEPPLAAAEITDRILAAAGSQESPAQSDDRFAPLREHLVPDESPPAEVAHTPESLEGDKINKEWTAFAEDSGSLGIPRAEMPQIHAEHRGALVQFLKARGITHQQEEVLPGSLKPTQAEYSQAKVDKARKFEGGDRAILVSAEGNVVDGHHQWMAKLTDSPSEHMRIIRLDAPVRELLKHIAEFPSVEKASPPTPVEVPSSPPPEPSAVASEAREPKPIPRPLQDAAREKDEVSFHGMKGFLRIEDDGSVVFRRKGSQEFYEVAPSAGGRTIEDVENLSLTRRGQKKKPKLFSLADETGPQGRLPRRAVREVERIVASLRQKLPGLPEIQILSQAEMRDRADGNPDASRVEGMFDPEDPDTIFLVPENIRLRSGETPLQAIQRVILHEGVGHRGVRGVLGQEYSRRLTALLDRTEARNPDFLREIYRDRPDLEPAEQDSPDVRQAKRLEAFEEWLARAAEDPSSLSAPEGNIFRRVLNWIIDLVDRALDFRISERDARTLLRQAFRYSAQPGTAGESTLQMAARVAPLDYANFRWHRPPFQDDEEGARRSAESYRLARGSAREAARRIPASVGDFRSAPGQSPIRTRYGKDGSITIETDPGEMIRDIRTKTRGDSDAFREHVADIFGEEIIHAQHLAILRQQWEEAGKPIPFDRYVRREVKALADDIQSAIESQSDPDVRRAAQAALDAAQSLYGDDSPLVIGAEFTRQIVQQARTHGISEERFLRLLADFPDQWQAALDSLSVAASGLPEGTFGERFERTRETMQAALEALRRETRPENIRFSTAPAQQMTGDSPFEAGAASLARDIAAGTPESETERNFAAALSGEKSPNVLAAALSIVKRELVPMGSVPREAAALIREARIADAYGRQIGIDWGKLLARGEGSSILGFQSPGEVTEADRSAMFSYLTGDESAGGRLRPELRKIADRVRSVIDNLGQRAVDAGLLNPETYERNKGVYLPRLYRPKELAERGLLGAGRKLLTMILDRTGKPRISDAICIIDSHGNPVSHDERGNFRFESEHDRDVFYDQLMNRTVLKRLRQQGGVGAVEESDIANPSRLASGLQSRIRILKADFIEKYEKNNPWSQETLDRMGLIREPGFPAAKAIVQLNHDISLANLFRQFAANPQWVSDIGRPDFVQIAQHPRWGALSGKFVQSGIARELNEMANAPHIAAAIYDGAMRRWKKWKTVYNPATHGRNVMGNLMFADLAGCDPLNPLNWRYYAETIRTLRGGGRRVTIDELHREGVLSGEFTKNELREVLDSEATVGLLPENMGNKVFGLITLKAVRRFAEKSYRVEDDLFKVAAYIKARDRGMTPKEAAAHVRTWFPFYDMIPKSGTMAAGKRMFPFISFFYESVRIAGNALSNPVERPVQALKFAKWMAIPSLMTLWSLARLGLDDDDEKAVLADMRGRLGGWPVFSALMPFADSEGRPVQWDLSFVNPYANMLGLRLDRTDEKPLWQDILRTVLTSNPAGDIGISLATNEDQFSGKELIVPGMNAPETAAEIGKFLGKKILPPLTPGVGTIWNTLTAPQRNRGTLQKRDQGQAALRALAGVDLRSAEPALWRAIERYQRENGYAERPERLGETAVSRSRGRLYSALINDDMPAMRRELAYLEREGITFESDAAIRRWLRSRHPILGAGRIRAADEQDFLDTLSPIQRQAAERAIEEYERIVAEASERFAAAEG